MFNVKATRTTETTVNPQDIREKILGDSYLTIAQMILNEDFNREIAVAIMKPLQDSIHIGARVKGHMSEIESAVNEYLDAALSYIEAPEDTTEAA